MRRIYTILEGKPVSVETFMLEGVEYSQAGIDRMSNFEGINLEDLPCVFEDKDDFIEWCNLNKIKYAGECGIEIIDCDRTYSYLSINNVDDNCFSVGIAKGTYNNITNKYNRIVNKEACGEYADINETPKEHLLKYQINELVNGLTSLGYSVKEIITEVKKHR